MVLCRSTVAKNNEGNICQHTRYWAHFWKICLVTKHCLWRPLVALQSQKQGNTPFWNRHGTIPVHLWPFELMAAGPDGLWASVSLLSNFGVERGECIQSWRHICCLTRDHDITRWVSTAPPTLHSPALWNVHQLPKVWHPFDVGLCGFGLPTEVNSIEALDCLLGQQVSKPQFSLELSPHSKLSSLPATLAEPAQIRKPVTKSLGTGWALKAHTLYYINLLWRMEQSKPLTSSIRPKIW